MEIGLRFWLPFAVPNESALGLKWPAQDGLHSGERHRQRPVRLSRPALMGRLFQEFNDCMAVAA